MPSSLLSAEQFASIRDNFFNQLNTLQQQLKDQNLPQPKTRRFSDPAWSSDPSYLFSANYYELVSDTVDQFVAKANLSDDARQQLEFGLMQWLEAMSPVNYFLTNPMAIQKAIESNGASIAQGINLMLNDLKKGRLTQTDETAFVVGENIAITAGQVVYQNPIMQLIQYSAQTDSVYEKPLLVVPPCINKYYILDLQENNSFVLNAVQQGFTVFLISWRNPLSTDNDGIQQATWGDYLNNGVLDAIDTVKEITNQDQINALGFCVGGTMLASALAIAKSKGEDPVNSLTLLTSLLDFTDTGVLNVFVNEVHASMRDQQFASGGLMTAQELATTFSFLRPGELVWNYVSNGYLMGKEPPAFDLLYWNSDGTNLPGPFFAWYFRNTYLENNLVKPDFLSIDGNKVDLSSLDMPSYVYASREDHIVPWQGAYASLNVLKGDRRFVLGASGHIAGVINPPARNRRNYWTSNTDIKASQSAVDSQDWIENSEKHDGSWWPDWSQWLKQQSGDLVKATKTCGSEKFPTLEDAPGSYVKTKAV